MPPTVWQQAQVMLVNIDHDNGAKAKLFFDNGFRCVQLQTHIGVSSRHAVADVLTYLKPYRARGFKCGHWGYLDKTDPKLAAQCAAKWDKDIQSDFYVPNAELEYKYTDRNGQPDPVAYARSETFCVEYDRLSPGKPVGLSSYSRWDMADLHWAPWLNILNARALPQSYVNEVGWHATPALSFKGATDVKQTGIANRMFHPKTHKVIPGFPLSYVHVCIPKPDPSDKIPLTVDDWITMLLDAKAVGHTLGFSIYEAENWAVQDIVKLGNAIKTHKLAAL